MVIVSRPATKLTKLQGRISNQPKGNKTETLLKTLLLWGNEIKLFEKKAHGKELFSFNYDAYCCIKGLNLWEGEELIPLPTPTCNKNTASVWEMASFQTVPEKELIPFRPSFRLLLFIPKFKDHDKDKKLSEPLPKGELGVGDKFEYPQKLTKNAWKLSFPVFSTKLCNCSSSASFWQQWILSLACH